MQKEQTKSAFQPERDKSLASGSDKVQQSTPRVWGRGTLSRRFGPCALPQGRAPSAVRGPASPAAAASGSGGGSTRYRARHAAVVPTQGRGAWMLRRAGLGDFGRASPPQRSLPLGPERLGGDVSELWRCQDGALTPLTMQGCHASRMSSSRGVSASFHTCWAEDQGDGRGSG